MNGLGRVARWTIVFVVLALAIIVPFVIWEAELAVASERLLASETNRLALACLAALLLALDVVLPVPSSFVSAALVAAIGPVAGAVSIWVGMSAGSLAGYALGRSGTPLVRRFVGELELERAERLMRRYGNAVLVLCRGVPVLAEASVVVAGAARVRFLTFAVVTGAANLGLSLAYALLSRFGWGGSAAVATPFVLGIAVPGAAIAVARRFERQPR